MQRPQYQETDTMVVIITVDSIIVLTKLQSTEEYLANLFFASNFVNF